MEAQINPLYRLNLSLVQLFLDNADVWEFVPLHKRSVEKIGFIDNRYLIAFGGGSGFSIWSIADRSEVARSSYRSHSKKEREHYCFVPSRNSVVFHCGWNRIGDSAETVLREIFLDGSEPLEHLTENHDPWLLGAVDGGPGIVTGSTSYWDLSVFRHLNLETGETSRGFLPRGLRNPVGGRWRTSPRALSPDGRLAARAHLGSFLWYRADGIVAGTDASNETYAVHPDIVARRGEDCFGVALELYDTMTGKLYGRLLAGFLSTSEFDRLTQSAGWTVEQQLEHVNRLLRPTILGGYPKSEKPLLRVTLENMAETYPYDRWNGDTQIVYRGYEKDDPAWALGELMERAAGFVLPTALKWCDDGKALEVSIKAQYPSDFLWARRVTLSGASEVVHATPKPNRRIDQERLDQIERRILDERVEPIWLADRSSKSLCAAMDEMRARIRKGLDELAIGPTLAWRFRCGGELFDEWAFVELLKSLPDDCTPEIVGHLRNLISDFGAVPPPGRQGFPMVAEANDALSSHDINALTPLVLHLVNIDPNAGDVLRGWLLSLDQEHDSSASKYVLPAYAKRWRFANRSALSFGIFYIIQQWQGPGVPIEELGIIGAAYRDYTPDAFVNVVIAELEILKQQAPELAQISFLTRFLDPAGMWDQQVAKLLDQYSSMH